MGTHPCFSVGEGCDIFRSFCFPVPTSAGCSLSVSSASLSALVPESHDLHLLSFVTSTEDSRGQGFRLSTAELDCRHSGLPAAVFSSVESVQGWSDICAQIKSATAYVCHTVCPTETRGSGLRGWEGNKLGKDTLMV